jgi:putative endonuclease
MKESYIYILSNKNRTVLYIGVTSNLLVRIENHKIGKGSKFTKKYNVFDLMYFEKFMDVNKAIEREKQLKNWHSEWKWNLIKEKNPNCLDLYEELTLS